MECKWLMFLFGDRHRCMNYVYPYETSYPFGKTYHKVRPIVAIALCSNNERPTYPSSSFGGFGILVCQIVFSFSRSSGPVRSEGDAIRIIAMGCVKLSQESLKHWEEFIGTTSGFESCFWLAAFQHWNGMSFYVSGSILGNETSAPSLATLSQDFYCGQRRESIFGYNLTLR